MHACVYAYVTCVHVTLNVRVYISLIPRRSKAYKRLGTRLARYKPACVCVCMYYIASFPGARKRTN